MNDLSTAIITLNEQEKLEDCLKSLQNLDGEIIILDSGSTDKTLDIAKKYGAKIFHKKFSNFENQKNWAVSKATKKWILSVDADEIIPKNLADEIKESIKNDQFSGFLIPRRNFILGAEIKYSRWSPDKHIWLWQKGKGQWVGKVHEEVIVNGKIGQLKNSKLHYQEKSVSGFITGNDFYSSLLAQYLFKKGIRFSFGRLIADPVFEFLVRFFYKRGFLDEWRGFTLSYLMAIYKITVWVKVWELNNRKEL